MRHILLFIFLTQTSLVIANPLFSGFTAVYEVSRNDIVLGVSNRRLVVREQGKILDYASTTIPKGLAALFVSDRFMEHSLIYVTPHGLQPHRYDYQRTGGKKEIIFQARFDWQKKQILMSNQKEPQSLLPNAHDLLSFQLALMEGLYQGRRQFDFQITDHKRIQRQTLVYTKSQKINSSHGELDVLQLEHQAEKHNYRFTFWCAKQLHYLPIVIRKTEHDGDVVELKLKHLNKDKFQLYDEKPSGDDF